MKKILFIFLLNLIFLSHVKSEILTLSCGYLETPGKVWTITIDTVKQHLIQTGSYKLPNPSPALTTNSKITIIDSRLVDDKNNKKYQKRFQDKVTYIEDVMFKEINRYSGNFNMYRVIVDNKHMNFLLEKIKKIRKSKNFHVEMERFAKKNDRPGFRYDNFGDGVCKKANKQF